MFIYAWFMHECMSILSQPLHGEQRWETGMETKCGVIIYQKKKKKQIYFAHFFLGSEGREI